MVEMDKYRNFKWQDHETMKQAQVALDMMRDFHGKTMIETHGEDAEKLKKEFGIDKWDKNHEYKIWLLQSLIRSETAQNPDDVFTEFEWQDIEAYATENSGIDESIVSKGRIFRRIYSEYSQKYDCVKIEGSNLIIDKDCRIKCLEKAVSESDFLSYDELINILEDIDS